ncbi:ABC transporter substrate-binding protein, partial [Candidatus Bipolaricaulota bacterium]|nr:ABC transporter substrate-binding protein [Candidatus Bipolaricaulota bacterium]
DKAEKLNVEWMDYTKGPSLPILEENMRQAINENYIPYEPTLGEYVTKEEASERWSNLESWYEEMGHFWVDAGPLYLEDVSPTAEVVELSRFEDYPYPADRWLFMLEEE